MPKIANVNIGRVNASGILTRADQSAKINCIFLRYVIMKFFLSLVVLNNSIVFIRFR